MKIVVVLLLLCLCDPGRSDCQTDGLSCSKTMSKPLNFNSMRLNHVTQVTASQNNHLSSVYDAQNVLSQDKLNGEIGQEGEYTNGEQVNPGLNLSKTFGGFVKGRHGCRKFMSPRSYQKRYGGFVGIRKSARKWNNQKRFSEFLKQYLGITDRATDFNRMSGDFNQQNEV